MTVEPGKVSELLTKADPFRRLIVPPPPKRPVGTCATTPGKRAKHQTQQLSNRVAVGLKQEGATLSKTVLLCNSKIPPRTSMPPPP